MLFIGCQALVSDYTADLDSRSGQIDTQALCTLDSSAFAFEVDFASDAAFSELEAYYEAKNPELVAHLSDIAERFRSDEMAAGATYLRGAAGVGKSFATRNLTDAFAEEEQCGVELADLFAAAPEDLGFEVELAADLVTLDTSTVFNELPKVSEPNDFELSLLLEAAGCYTDGRLAPLIVLDGVDELHDETSRLILEAVDDFLLEQAADNTSFVHFLISGRPEGFSSWLTAPERTEENSEIVEQYDLKPPDYTGAGDLEYRVRGYLDFAKDPPLAEEEIQQYIQSFKEALKSYPFLSYSIGNLAVGNIVIEQTAPDLTFTEHSLKTAMFDDILLRNVGTHGRPGADSPLEGPYRGALEDIAARYVEVDAQGRFSVRSEDTVEVFEDDGTSLGLLRVRNVLGRSGVAFLIDPGTKTTRYRFDPFWLHAHLIERRNERLYDNYSYQACND
jgi:hypothetical protein